MRTQASWLFVVEVDVLITVTLGGAVEQERWIRQNAAE